MRSWKFTTPGLQHLTRTVVKYHIVLLVIGKQYKSSLAILHHFVAIFYRNIQRVLLTPGFVHTVFEITVADYMTFGFFSGIDVKRILGNTHTCRQERGVFDKISSFCLPRHKLQ